MDDAWVREGDADATLEDQLYAPVDAAHYIAEELVFRAQDLLGDPKWNKLQGVYLYAAPGDEVNCFVINVPSSESTAKNSFASDLMFSYMPAPREAIASGENRGQVRQYGHNQMELLTRFVQWCVREMRKGIPNAYKIKTLGAATTIGPSDDFQGVNFGYALQVSSSFRNTVDS